MAVFLLRCYQLGIKFSDLDDIEEGLVIDMIIESGNDSYDYPRKATKEDFDNF